MQILNKTTNFDFMGHRRMAIGISVVLVIASIAMLAIRGLNFGIDFTGGVQLEAGYTQTAVLKDIRSRLSDGGFDKVSVQHFGSTSDVLVRLPPDEGGSKDASELSERVLQLLRAGGQEVEHRRTDFVGPQVGEELREQGGLAMIVALLMILAYVAVRFQWKFSLGSVAALVHDVILTIGFFAAFQFQFDLTVVAAVLAVIGYSLNDTIVVFDRIRENFLTVRRSTPTEVVNLSINQTLSRTLITGVTTLLVLVALFFLGGEAIHVFALALIVGVVVGTYSSVYVASATALSLKITTMDLLPPQEKEPELDSLP
ncbi:MAG: protein translocase subunit SecF [Pseudomonadota bacterium]